MPFFKAVGPDYKADAGEVMHYDSVPVDDDLKRAFPDALKKRDALEKIAALELAMSQPRRMGDCFNGTQQNIASHTFSARGFDGIMTIEFKTAKDDKNGTPFMKYVTDEIAKLRPLIV